MVSDRSSCHQNCPVRPRNENSFNNFGFDLDIQPVQAECPNGGEQMEQDPNGEGVSGEPEQETHEEFRTRVRPGPSEPSPMDRDHHEATGHSVFRNWCDACVEGRGRAVAHTSHDHQHYATPVLSWDYGFLGTKTHGGEEDRIAEQSGQTPVLCMRDRKSQGCFWYAAPAKGTDFPTINNLIRKILTDLRTLAYLRVCFRSDGERPTKIAVATHFDILDRFRGFLGD